MNDTTYVGRPGHPVVLERRIFAEVLALRGDTGARDVLCRHAVAEVELGAGGGDVDTPEQLGAMGQNPRHAGADARG